MNSVWLAEHPGGGQPKYFDITVYPTAMLCFPGLRPVIITQYPSVPDGSKRVPGFRGSEGPVKNTWPSLPGLATPARKFGRIDSCRFVTLSPSIFMTMSVNDELFRTVSTSCAYVPCDGTKPGILGGIEGPSVSSNVTIGNRRRVP